jgi:hypothetical protein
MHPSNKSLLSCTAPASSQNRNLTRWYLNEKDELSDRKSVPLNILRAKFLDSWFWAVQVAQQNHLLITEDDIAMAAGVAKVMVKGEFPGKKRLGY